MSAADAGLVTLLAVCAVTDVRTGRIYNVVTYPAILLGLTAAALGNGIPLPSAALGCAVGGATLYVMFALRWMGGGDVKLMAAVGAFRGFPFILNAMFYSIFVGGVCAAVILIWRGEMAGVAADLSAVARRGVGRAAEPIVPRGGSFPFGLAIGTGTLIALVIELR